MGIAYHLMFVKSDGKTNKHRGPFVRSAAETALANARKWRDDFAAQVARESDYDYRIDAVEVSDELEAILERAFAHKGEKGACIGCGSPHIGHWHGDDGWCCRCHVLTGNPAADWHSRCLSTYEEIHGKALPIVTPL